MCATHFVESYKYLTSCIQMNMLRNGQDLFSCFIHFICLFHTQTQKYIVSHHEAHSPHFPQFTVCLAMDVRVRRLLFMFNLSKIKFGFGQFPNPQYFSLSQKIRIKINSLKFAWILQIIYMCAVMCATLNSHVSINKILSRAHINVMIIYRRKMRSKTIEMFTNWRSDRKLQTAAHTTHISGPECDHFSY